jgi:radical SAM enzyme (TIGR01210 family)
MEPAYLRISPVNIDGRASRRLMIVLKTRGCEYARKNNGGCTVCGFLNHAGEDITGPDLLRQLDVILETADLNGVEAIDLLTLGSFLNDNEVDRDTRRALLERIGRLEGVRRVSVESRSEYVTVEKLGECKKLLGGKTMEFGIGLESSDDYIRNKIIKKGLSKRSFERVVKMVKEAGCNLLTYLLIKPPHLSEQEAVEDAIGSARYVFDTAAAHGVKARAAFEPVFICENTVLEDLFLSSSYRLVNLWSVVEIIGEVHGYGDIFLGLSDENLSMERMPSSCPRCTRTLIDEIERYNLTRDVSRLETLDCACKKQYEDERKRRII